ncbi:protein SIEVE ELEMENT OCCLUSION B [Ziziphus jujuba]|uniref:Protein SIEVE ELEMENT OCCLUSION B n=1 Tax=Ziziphus jujuba TaxID=326968 RepID=A0ABM4A3U3_ZIZJJ|nr:protein SIEVE ELEMENT OCCLUSION B [Ziziphus jujuba]
MVSPCSAQPPTGNLITLPAAITDEKVYLNIDNMTGNKKLDVDSLLNLVDNIIYASIPEEPQEQQGNITPELPHSFKSPLCSLKKISQELMACKAPGEVINIEKTAVEILNLQSVSSYPPDAKLALSVAALSLEFGEFWSLRGMEFADHQDHHQPSNYLPEKYVTRCIFELEKLRSQLYISSSDTIVPELSAHVHWTIMAVVSCATQISILKIEEGKPLDLSQWTHNLISILEELRRQKRVCQQQREIEVYSKLVNTVGNLCPESPNKVVEILKLLIYAENEAHPLHIKNSPKGESMDILKRKDVLLLISSTDISERDIAILKKIYNELHEKFNTYNIVWIPIEEQWTPERRNVFVEKRDQMPWHVVQFVSPIAGIKFIKEEWKYNGQPLLVLMNSQGKVENPNAIHTIRLWGMQAFPFTEAAEKINKQKIKNWLSLVTKNNIDDPNKDTPLDDCIKKDNYIFFYGGTDHDWIQKFKTKVTDVKSTAENPVSLLQLGNDGLFVDEEKLEIEVEGFWTRIESFYSVEVNNGSSGHETGQVLQKLLSYKTESRWAILTKGSSVIVADDGTKILRAVKKLLREKGRVENLEIKFKEYYNEVIEKFGHSCRIDIPGVAANNNILSTLKYCSICKHQMQIFISYKCINSTDQVPVNANHVDG